MNYGDHNFIEITQQTKLRVDTAKMHGLDTSNVSSRPKWNLGFSQGDESLVFSRRHADGARGKMYLVSQKHILSNIF